MQGDLFRYGEHALTAPFGGLGVDFDHPRSVARLALRLFELLPELHGLDETQAQTLYAAAMLHDIGWVGGQVRHHKRSMQMILEAKFEGITDLEQRRIACLARYHRRALPDPTHPVFCDLNADDRAQITSLAAVLRVADGLDRGQIGRVEDLSVAGLTDDIVHLAVRSPMPCTEELYGARKKADLFRIVFRRTLVVSRAPAIGTTEPSS